MIPIFNNFKMDEQPIGMIFLNDNKLHVSLKKGMFMNLAQVKEMFGKCAITVHEYEKPIPDEAEFVRFSKFTIDGWST